MAQVVLHANDVFPAGTTVSVYALANPSSPPPDAVPPGAVVTTAVVASDGSLTFTGLADDTRYWAYAQVSSDDRTVGFRTDSAALSGTAVVAVERTFTETTGAGVYTGTVDVPAGATILDIIVNGVALWTATTSAVMKVGDTDDDGFYTAIDLKATDLLAGESISFALAGGKAGAYIANSQVSPRYSAAVRSVKGIVTTVGAAGSAGRTRMMVVYSAPASADVAAATKV